MLLQRGDHQCPARAGIIRSVKGRQVLTCLKVPGLDQAEAQFREGGRMDDLRSAGAG